MITNKKKREGKRNRGNGRVVNAPVARGISTTNRAPRFTTQGDRLVIKHSEFVAVCPGSVTYSTGFHRRLNPADATTFPWLSAIADRFEKYRFRNLAFRYVPTVGTATSGSVYLAIDYDPGDSAPTTEVEITAYAGATTAQTWMAQLLKGVPKRLVGPQNGMYYTSQSATARERFEDSGYFYVGVVGMADGSTVGRIWVDYEVEFSIPHLGTGVRASPYGLYKLAADQQFVNTVPGNLNPTEEVPCPGLTYSAGVWTCTRPGAYRVYVELDSDDSNNEAFTTYTSILNGVTVEAESDAKNATGDEENVVVSAILSLIDGATLTVACILTGAAGVLAAKAGLTQVIIVPNT